MSSHAMKKQLTRPIRAAWRWLRCLVVPSPPCPWRANAKVGTSILGCHEGKHYIVTFPDYPNRWPQAYWHREKGWTNGIQDDGNIWACLECAKRVLDDIRNQGEQP